MVTAVIYYYTTTEYVTLAFQHTSMEVDVSIEVSYVYQKNIKSIKISAKMSINVFPHMFIFQTRQFPRQLYRLDQ